MLSLRENKGLMKLLLIPIAGAFMIAMDPPDFILEYLSITYEGVPD